MMRRFCSGSVDAGEQRQVAFFGLHVDQVDVELVAEDVHDLLGLVEPQHAVVDEDAGQLIADRAVQQRGHDAGVDAAGQPADHAIGAHQLANALDGLVDDVDHRPHRRDARRYRAGSVRMICWPYSVCATSGWNWVA